MKSPRGAGCEMRFLYGLYMRWEKWTYFRAHQKASVDLMTYGTSYVKKYWYGYRHIPVRGVHAYHKVEVSHD